MRFHYKVREGEEILQYVDVMSLYPYVCKYYKFPVGHPLIHVGESSQVREAQGLIKCCIQPPQRLYIPVFPYRCNSRLMFCLCSSCATECNTDGECAHEKVAERALICTWVIDKIRKAVRKGYEIVEIIEIYEYAVTQYDTQTGEGGLFVEYIERFLKLRTEASGYQSWVRTPEFEDRYIANFFASEGILLDKELIRPNEKRGMAKLCLNSMWAN